MIKIVIIKGGLGNQMFGYALALKLCKSPLNIVILDLIDTWYSHNGYELYNLFGIKKKYKYKYYSRLRKLTCSYLTRYFFIKIIENPIDYCSFNSSYFKPTCKFQIYDGFWQSEKYFKSIEPRLRNKFKFDIQRLSTESLEYLKIIQNSSSVSIHIRRGDYLNHENEFGNICTVEYYIKAINYLKSKYIDLTFFIFTDDKDWVHTNFNINQSYIVDCNNGKDSWQDMCLMSNCKHNIIANSTFSWWGAWLNENPNKNVIAPEYWMNSVDCRDIIPENWIKI